MKYQVKIEGTSADRIAALTLSIRESSLANVSELEPLLAFMEKRKGSRELVARSMEALGELFRMYLLPDRKLKFFEQQSVHVRLIHRHFASNFNHCAKYTVDNMVETTSS